MHGSLHYAHGNRQYDDTVMHIYVIVTAQQRDCTCIEDESKACIASDVYKSGIAPAYARQYAFGRLLALSASEWEGRASACVRTRGFWCIWGDAWHTSRLS